MSRQHVQVLLFKMEFELNLSTSIYVRAPFILKLPWYLEVFAKGITQQITASGVVAMNLVRVP